MVVDKKHTHTQKKSVELEASLAPAEAEVGAVAKADQLFFCKGHWGFTILQLQNFFFGLRVFHCGS